MLNLQHFLFQAVTLAFSYVVHFLVFTSYLNPEYTQVLTFVFISHFKPKVDLLNLNTNLAFWVFVSWCSLEFAFCSHHCAFCFLTVITELLHLTGYYTKHPTLLLATWLVSWKSVSPLKKEQSGRKRWPQFHLWPLFWQWSNFGT